MRATGSKGELVKFGTNGTGKLATRRSLYRPSKLHLCLQSLHTNSISGFLHAQFSYKHRNKLNADTRSPLSNGLLQILKSLEGTFLVPISNLPLVLLRVSLGLPNQDSVVVMLWFALYSVVVNWCTAWPAWPGAFPGAWVSPGVSVVCDIGKGEPGVTPSTGGWPGTGAGAGAGCKAGCWPGCGVGCSGSGSAGCWEGWGDGCCVTCGCGCWVTCGVGPGSGSVAPPAAAPPIPIDGVGIAPGCPITAV